MSQISAYTRIFGLKSVPFQSTGQSMDSRYRVVLPKSASALVDEIGKVLELDQTAMVVVRGVVGSGKTRLLSELCRMMRSRDFGQLQDTREPLAYQRMTALRMKRGFGFNVELDKLNIGAFESRFHDSIVEFLPSEERSRFLSSYSQRRSQVRRQYNSETTVARKLVTEMVDILRRFGYDYFLICIDEFDIILGEQQAGQDYVRDVVEFLNSLNEISKDLSNRNLPILIALLQTHYANKYFYDYVRKLADATGSRINPRFDITLGYDYEEMKEFVKSRLEPERIAKASDPLSPFSEAIIKVLYQQFEDKGEKKILSLRSVEQALLRLLETGLKNDGKLTVEIAQQVASEFVTDTSVRPASDVPPEIAARASLDLTKSPVEKVNMLMNAVESYLSKSRILSDKLSDVAETVQVSNDVAITRIFYELVHANNKYDVAFLFCMFRSGATSDLQKRVDETLNSRPYPQKIIVLAYSPGDPLLDSRGAELISLKTEDLKLVFAASRMVEMPEEISRQISFIFGKILSAIADISDIPKATKIPAYCVNALTALALAHVKGNATVEEIKNNLDLLHASRYERNLPQYLSQLRDWGLARSEATSWKPLVPPSFERALSIQDGQSISNEDFRILFPNKRGENAESLLLQLGYFVEENRRLTRRGLDYWRTKFSDSVIEMKKYSTSDGEVRKIKELFALSDGPYNPWRQVAAKVAVDEINDVTERFRTSKETREALIRKLTQLRQDTNDTRPGDKYQQQLKDELLNRIKNALQSPETSDLVDLQGLQETLLELTTKSQVPRGLREETQEALANIPDVLGRATGPKYGGIEEDLLRVISDEPVSFNELTSRLKEYSEDVIKTVLLELIESNKIRLIRRRDGESH